MATAPASEPLIRHTHARQATLHTAPKGTALQVLPHFVRGQLEPRFFFANAQERVSAESGSGISCH